MKTGRSAARRHSRPPFLKGASCAGQHRQHRALSRSRHGWGGGGPPKTERQAVRCINASSHNGPGARVHDTHHPSGPRLDSRTKRAAARKSTRRIWTNACEISLDIRRGFEGQWQRLHRAKITYATVAFQIVEGRRYAFPNRTNGVRAQNSPPDRTARPYRRAAEHPGLI